MTVGARRKLRLFFKFGVLVCLPLTGYLWALTGFAWQSIAMTAVCVVMAIGAEGLASVSESRLLSLRLTEEAAEREYEAEAQLRDERLRQMDRIVETLSNQNHDLRGKLLSVHGEVHRVQEEHARLIPETPVAAPKDAKPENEESGAEVTDISSLRRR